MHVLLVDDSPIFLKIMRKVLSNSIFHLDIEEENEGRAGACALRSETDRCRVLCVNMPGLNQLQTPAR